MQADTGTKMIHIGKNTKSTIVYKGISTEQSHNNEEQLFYLRSRGLGFEDAVSLVVSGFCKKVFDELPLEFAQEAKNLLTLKLEHSVG